MIDDLRECLCDLIAIPSVSDRREECHRVLDYVERTLGGGHGLHLWQVEDAGVRSLVVSTRPSRHAALVLNAHMDVVWAPEEQFRPSLREGFLWGRGTYDMKGAGASFVVLLSELARMPVDSRPDLQVQFVTDEEVGGHHGAQRLVAEGFTGDLFVAGEPTDLNLCHRAKGLLWLTVRQPGRPGHAAMPWLGDNPLVRLQEGLASLLSSFPAPGSPEWRTTVTPTFLQAGHSHNRIPESAVLKLDIRRVPEDSLESLKSSVASAFPAAEVEVVQEAVALDTDPSDPQVQRLVQVQEEMTGRSPVPYSEHFASDARYWGALGVPSVCWGPAGAGMHADDERVDLASLEAYHRMVRRLAGLP